MVKKISQIQNLIATIAYECRDLEMQLQKLKVCADSIDNKIMRLVSENKELDDRMQNYLETDAAGYVTRYANIKQYKLILQKMIDDERKSLSKVNQNISKVEEHALSLKIKAKGYDILINKYKSELHHENARKNSKIIDEAWLLKSTAND